MRAPPFQKQHPRRRHLRLVPPRKARQTRLLLLRRRRLPLHLFLLLPFFWIYIRHPERRRHCSPPLSEVEAAVRLEEEEQGREEFRHGVQTKQVHRGSEKRHPFLPRRLQPQQKKVLEVPPLIQTSHFKEERETC